MDRRLSQPGISAPLAAREDAVRARLDPRTMTTRRVLAITTICVVVAAVAPAAPRGGRQVWAATAIPEATLEPGGTGFGVSALSSDGRVAVVAGTRAVYVFRASSEGSWDSISKPVARLRLPRSAVVNLTAVATSSDGA